MTPNPGLPVVAVASNQGAPSPVATSGPLQAKSSIQTESDKALAEAKKEGVITSIKRCLEDPVVELEDLEDILLRRHRLRKTRHSQSA